MYLTIQFVHTPSAIKPIQLILVRETITVYRATLSKHRVCRNASAKRYGTYSKYTPETITYTRWKP